MSMAAALIREQPSRPKRWKKGRSLACAAQRNVDLAHSVFFRV